MPIIDGKVAALGPHLHVFARGRLRHVQNDRDTILVVVSLDALVRVCSVRSDQTVRFRCKLSQLVVF